MRVLQIGSDRSKTGTLVPGSAAATRQEAYAQVFGHLDDISFTLQSDEFRAHETALKSVTPTNSVAKIFYGIDAIRIARKLLRPDIVSAQDPFEAGLTAYVVSRMLGVPLYVQIHTDFLSPEYAQHSSINMVRTWAAGFVLRRAARVRVVSERIKTSILKRYRLTVPVTVLPIFVDVERFRNIPVNVGLAGRFEKFTPKLLVVSRLESEKNIPLALRAFAKSAPKQACLIVLGEGSERAVLESVTHELGISECVFFEGDKDVAPYYQIADLVLVPSLYEGYGLVTIEALAAGKPVLSTDVGIVQESGGIATTAEKFSEALSRWFKNGPRIGVLRNYPYKDFGAYVQAYSRDIAACLK